MKKNTKFIIITGGVLSGIGKGVAAASMGRLLNKNLKIIPIKMDGYLNVDSGTMNPHQHGEAFVLDDGGETDMDFGHYERFMDISCKFKWSITMGKIFEIVRDKERHGDFLGQTVQFMPHVVDVIKDRVFEIAEEEEADIMLIEIGGTVGDIENELFIRATQQLKTLVGKDNVIYIHVTYIPIPYGVNEQKSKPTQQSVGLLKERGINPDVLLCRCHEKLKDSVVDKLSTFCDVKKENIITAIDSNNIYKIPILLDNEGMTEILHKHLKIYSPPELFNLKRLLNKPSNDHPLNIGIVGKYYKLEDSYFSIFEALKHCALNLGLNIEPQIINSEMLEIENYEEILKTLNCDGIIVPGGFGSRGTDGKINAIKYARENNIPFLGICFGLQLAIVEFARNVCGVDDAHSIEIDPNTPHPLINIMPDQVQIKDKGGTMRLGVYEAQLMVDTKVQKIYNNDIAIERHRHRYEVNPKYHDMLEERGMIISGTSLDGMLVEFIELKENDHPFFVATQAHPELKSRIEKPAPLFKAFIEEVKRNKILTNK